jgi:hypothetical protein
MRPMDVSWNTAHPVSRHIPNDAISGSAASNVVSPADSQVRKQSAVPDVGYRRWPWTMREAEEGAVASLPHAGR